MNPERISNQSIVSHIIGFKDARPSPRLFSSCTIIPDRSMEQGSASSNSSYAEVGKEKISTQHDGVRDKRSENSVDTAEKGVAILRPPELEPEPQHRGDGLQRSVTAQEWNGPDDPENPQNWPLWQRVYHTYVHSLHFPIRRPEANEKVC